MQRSRSSGMSKRMAAVGVVLGALVGVGCSGDSTTPSAPTVLTVVNATFTVQSLNYKWFSFSAPTSGQFAGNFSATGGTDSKIEVMLMTSQSFERWQAGNTVTAAYYSGEVNAASANLLLPPGEWRLVFSGLKNPLFDRAVAANYTFTY